MVRGADGGWESFHGMAGMAAGVANFPPREAREVMLL
jgi:hypothetical protein